MDDNNKEYVENRFAAAPITSKEIVILAAIGTLILALALYFIPWPTYIEFHGTGAEFDAQGNVVAEGDFILHAWYYDYLFQDDRLSLEHLEMPNIEIEGITEFSNGLPSLTPYPREPDRLWGMIMYEVPHPNGQEGWTVGKGCAIYTTPDFCYFLIRQIDADRIFIGAGEDAPDYMDILDQCHMLKD